MDSLPDVRRRPWLNLRTIGDQWRDFWQPPDPLLLHEGGGGEFAVAAIRLGVIGALLIATASQMVLDPQSDTALVGTVVASLALAIALAIYLLARRHFYKPWFGFTTSIIDVSLVTLALVAFMLVGRPDIAVNSRVIYSVYFIAIGATALRNDPRICVVAGLVGAFEYGALVGFAELRWGLTSDALLTSSYGSFDLGAHYARLVLLVCGTAVSMGVALRTERLRWLAAKDPLTLLLNRGTFDERMQAEVARSVRHNHLLSIALIDIDHFKEFNDTFGHLVGDEVLRLIADIIQAAVRKSDLVARYGGEEFIVLFPETPAERALEKAQELRVAVQESTVTVSIGVAELPTDGTDMRSIVDCADQRLYEAKRSGRNRAVGPTPSEVAAS